MSGGVTVHDFVALFSPWELFVHLFPYFARKREPPDMTHREERQNRRTNRLLLQRFLILAALMPGMTPCVNGLSPRFHSRSPTIAVANTGILSGANLETLKTNVNRSQHLCPLVIPGGAESLPLLLDCGASASTSPSLDDFVPGTLSAVPGNLSMKGIGGNVRIEQMGILSYTTVDDKGHPFEIRTPGLYMPDLPQRLFSPQIYFSTGGKGGSLLIREGEAKLESTSGQILSLPLDPTSKLYYVHCFEDAKAVQFQANTLSDSLNLTSDSNTNLTRRQKLLLRLHHAFAHCGLSTIRHICKLGWLGSNALGLGKQADDDPVCGSCQYGKAHKRNPGTKTEVPNPETAGNITKNQLNPGDQISMDHFVVRTNGRRLETKGKEHHDKMFKGGTIFVDAASGKITLKFQVSLRASETIQSKMEFERTAFSYGVRVKSYRTDNGVFTAQAFIDEIHQRSQTISFSGSGA
jgi:hypothetical protein